MDTLLREYLEQTESDCPNCGHRLTVQSRCGGCGDHLYLAIEGAKLRPTVLSRRWCLVFIPWLLFCFGATNEWVNRVFGILLGNQEISIYYLPVSTDPLVVVFWFTGWLTWLAPVICIYLWLDRRRINTWPSWAIWLGFGLAVFIWLWDLAFLMRMFFSITGPGAT